MRQCFIQSTHKTSNSASVVDNKIENIFHSSTIFEKKIYANWQTYTWETAYRLLVGKRLPRQLLNTIQEHHHWRFALKEPWKHNLKVEYDLLLRVSIVYSRNVNNFQASLTCFGEFEWVRHFWFADRYSLHERWYVPTAYCCYCWIQLIFIEDVATDT